MEIDQDEIQFRIATGGSNWVNIAGQVMLGLGGGLPYPGRDLPWPHDGNISVKTTGGDWTASSALRMIRRGEAEAAITTPPATARMANKGVGHFVERHNLRAVAHMPHDDWLGFAVQADSDIESLRQIREEEMGINLARAPSQSPPMRNITGMILDEVLKQYGISDQRIEEWGGSINQGGRKVVEGIQSGEYDALFDEAMMTPDWKEITDTTDLRFLSVEDDILDHLSTLYGLEKATIPEGYLPGVASGIDTVSMSGWLLVIDGSLSDAVAYHVTRALDERRSQIHRFFESKSSEYTNPPLSDSIDMNEAWKGTKIPLHPGAKAYYEEKGYK